MSAITNYLKMSSAELEEEISRQKKKINTINENIQLLKRLQVAANASPKSNKSAPVNSNFQQPQKGDFDDLLTDAGN